MTLYELFSKKYPHHLLDSWIANSYSCPFYYLLCPNNHPITHTVEFSVKDLQLKAVLKKIWSFNPKQYELLFYFKNVLDESDEYEEWSDLRWAQIYFVDGEELDKYSDLFISDFILLNLEFFEKIKCSITENATQEARNYLMHHEFVY